MSVSFIVQQYSGKLNEFNGKSKCSSNKAFLFCTKPLYFRCLYKTYLVIEFERSLCLLLMLLFTSLQFNKL